MITVILNDGPYGTERSYNGLRLAISIVKEKEKIRIFLIGDAVTCVVKGQTTPNGFYNIERMIKSFIQRGGLVHT